MTLPRLAREKAAHQPGAMPLAARLGVVIVTGWLVGAATSVLQAYLDPPWLSLVNAASPWLAVMFMLGALWPGPVAAALAGLTAGWLELAGYYVTAAVRGYPAGHGIVLFWAACAVVGGPVCGAAGWLWWRGPRRLSALGAAVVPAAFLAEATVVYAWRLHYRSSAILFAVLGAVFFAITGFRGRQYARAGLWLLAVFPVTVVAELIVGLVYSQSF